MGEVKNNLYYIPDERNNQFEITIDTLKNCGDIEYTRKNINDNEKQKIYYTLNQSVLGSYDNNFLNSDVINRLKTDENFALIIYSAHESVDDVDFKKLKKYSIKNDINQEKIYLINNSSNMDFLQEKNETKFNHYKLNILSYIKINDMFLSTVSFFDRNKNGKFFMTFNKEDKKHRYALLIKLMKHNLLDDTNWSFLPTNRDRIDTEKLKQIFNDEHINQLHDEIEYFQKLNYKFSDFEINNSYSLQNVLNLTMVENVENYKNSYINLTTESVFDQREDVIHITEKSFKPFFYYQFPLILSSEYHIKKMKELYNLDFYEDIIDYSYDNIKDDKIRFEKYFGEVLRLYNNKQFFINFYNNNQERFEKNKSIVLDIRKKLDDDYKYICDLT